MLLKKAKCNPLIYIYDYMGVILERSVLNEFS